MKIAYTSENFRRSTQQQILKANNIIEEYNSKGLSLTLRQVYYQFVARGWLENNDKEYTNLGNLLNKARLAGWVDWDAIEDRTRFIRKRAQWGQPKEILDSAAQSFHLDLWATQPEYVEVWVEKDALIGVVQKACHALDVPHFSCRGYSSVTELHEAAHRLMSKQRPVTIIHLGDHDPSGIDMSRDIFARINLFMLHHGHKPAVVERIALNMDQIDLYQPPPNPAKVTDSRAAEYIKEFGHESWELDAIEPTALVTLIEEKVNYHMDKKLFNVEVEKQEYLRKSLKEIAHNFDEVKAYLGQNWRGVW
jgi:hypothetical protein